MTSAVLILILLAPPPQEQTFRSKVRPFLETHCVRCHGEAKPKGKIRLDNVSAALAAGKDAAVWEKVLDQLDAGEMPPRKRPRPKASDVEAVSRWIRANLDKAGAVLARKRGRVILRRLNTTEYTNTIRDLFGIEYDAGASFPQDNVAHGFDNQGEALTLSPLLLEKYMRAAERITDRVILKERPKTVRGRWKGTEMVWHKSKAKRIGDTVTFFLVGKNNGAGAFSPYPFPFKTNGFVTSTPGMYRVRVHAHPVGPLTRVGSHRRAFFQPKHLKEPEPEGFEAPRLYISRDGDLAGRFYLEDRKPKTYEFTIWCEAGKKFGFKFENGIASIKPDYIPKFKGPGVVIHWMELEGPLVETWPTKAYRSLFFKETEDETPAYARAILERFARRAYRRPPAKEDVDALMVLFEGQRGSGASFEDSVAAAVQRALCSPKFLYLVEPSNDAAARKLNAHEFASRLSYFLWSTMPDEELFRAAEDGSLLRNPEPQVRRMLKDPKARALAENFAGQWLRLRDVQNIAVDRVLYPDFTDYLRQLFLRETEAFFMEILNHDLSILNFVDSDFAMLNDRLAEHYGVAGVKGSHFRRVKLKNTAQRGGVMTQGSVLMLTTCGTRSSPIRRGVWLLESLMGRHVPPPPKDVPELPAEPKQRVSMRKRLEVHRSVEACAKCHDRIDPLGFPLEHYDVIGRWRDTYGIQTRYGYRKGPAVDPKTEFTSGEAVDGPEALRKLLLKQKDQFSRGFVERMLTYGLGRGISLGDRSAVEALVGSLEKNRYRMADLIVDIAKSELFQTK